MNSIETRLHGDVHEHRHNGYTYWHPETRVHTEQGTGKLSDLDEPSIPIEEIEDVSFDETKKLLVQRANVERRGSNPNDAWALVNIHTGEFFFAGIGLYLGKEASKEWRKIGWNADYEEE